MEQVNISAATLWCPRHAEVLRFGGTSAIERSTFDLLHRVLLDVLWEDPPDLQGALLDRCPMCCHVGDDVMHHIYATHVPMN